MKKLFIYIMTYANILILLVGLNNLILLSCEKFGNIIGFLILTPLFVSAVSYSIYLMLEEL